MACRGNLRRGRCYEEVENTGLNTFNQYSMGSQQLKSIVERGDERNKEREKVGKRCGVVREGRK